MMMRRVLGSVATAAIVSTNLISAQGLDGTPQWSVSSKPTLSIGVVNGSDSYLFYDVTSIRVTSRGQIIVANAGTRELRVFDSDGAFVRVIGRRGQGLGEYQHLTGVELFAQDSVVVFDRDLRRISLFAPSGEFLRSFLVEAPGDSPAPVEALVGVVDGKAMMVGARYAEPQEYPAPTGIERIPNTVFAMDLTTGQVELVAEVRGTERGYIVHERGMRFAPLPHRRWAVISAFGGGLLIGDNALATMRLLKSNGTVQQTIDTQVPLVRLQWVSDARGLPESWPDIRA